MMDDRLSDCTLLNHRKVVYATEVLSYEQRAEFRKNTDKCNTWMFRINPLLVFTRSGKPNAVTQHWDGF